MPLLASARGHFTVVVVVAEDGQRRRSGSQRCEELGDRLHEVSIAEGHVVPHRARSDSGFVESVSSTARVTSSAGTRPLWLDVGEESDAQTVERRR
jgi:hypothetical protein